MSYFRWVCNFYVEVMIGWKLDCLKGNFFVIVGWGIKEEECYLKLFEWGFIFY